MARLLVKTDGVNVRTFELRLGVNRVGRNPDADFILTDPSISFNHCEFIVSNDGVFVRDCDSTNGTFVNNQMVKAARLQPGQTLRLADVSLTIEFTEPTVAIPKIAPVKPPVPLTRADGARLCRRHPQVPVTFRCTHCHEEMCTTCVHTLRLQGGAQVLQLCPLCSHKCERIGSLEPQKKKNILGDLPKTVRLKFGGRPKE